MKSAKQWLEMWPYSLKGVRDLEIKAIQLDAYKAGMTEAAKISETVYDEIAGPNTCKVAGREISEHIQDARDNKTVDTL